MNQYDNTNRGSLFKNNRKENEKHADYNGSINVDGHDFWLNAWLKTDRNGNKFMSLSVKRKDGTAARPEAKSFVKEAKRHFPDAKLDDDVPF